MYKLLRSILFFFDPEKVHYFTTDSLHFIFKIPGVKWCWKKYFTVEDEKLETEVDRKSVV